MKILKNAPFNKDATIVILEDSPEWDEAYKNWQNMDNPTKDVRWKQGVFLSEVTALDLGEKQ